MKSIWIKLHHSPGMRQRLSDSQPILVHSLNLLQTLLDAQNMEKIGRDNGEVQNIAIEPNDDCNR